MPGRLEQAAPVEAVVLEPAVEEEVADTAVPVGTAVQGMPPDCWLDLWWVSIHFGMHRMKGEKQTTKALLPGRNFSYSKTSFMKIFHYPLCFVFIPEITDQLRP